MAVSIRMTIEMVDTVRQLETDLLLEALFQLFGSDFRGHERPFISEKLSFFMKENGFPTISSLQNSVIHEAGVAAKLLHRLTYRPTGVFDEAPAFRNVRELAEPLLRSYARPKVWIPECATAEEVFTVAILLEEADVYDRAVIHATCSNPALLDEIRQGRFALERVDAYERAYLASGGKESFSRYWSRKQGHAEFHPRLQRNITFSEYNLSTDTSFNEFHLIVCRKRLPEFGHALRRRVLDVFSDSLVRFGILFADPLDEFEMHPPAGNYKAISREQGIYRRTYRIDSLRRIGAVI
jgi:chemotaxis protein methyltransferase CheR